MARGLSVRLVLQTICTGLMANKNHVWLDKTRPAFRVSRKCADSHHRPMVNAPEFLHKREAALVVPSILN
jgi:hypothetical protein